MLNFKPYIVFLVMSALSVIGIAHASAKGNNPIESTVSLVSGNKDSSSDKGKENKSAPNENNKEISQQENKNQSSGSNKDLVNQSAPSNVHEASGNDKLLNSVLGGNPSQQILGYDVGLSAGVNNNILAMNDKVLSAIPEPETYMMLLVGLVLLGLSLKRKN